MDVATRQSRAIADATGFRGGSWAANGTILFAPTEGGALFRTTSDGGTVVPVTQLDAANGFTSHRTPWFLPDGTHFLFRAQSTDPERSGIYVGSLDGMPPKRLVSADSHAMYASPGVVIYNSRGTLFAHSFDTRSLRLSGDPIALATGVGFSSTGASAFAAGESLLVYRPGSAGGGTNGLQWVDRSGSVLSDMELPPALYANPDVSQSGMVAVQRLEGALTDIWVNDAPGTPLRRVTASPPSSEAPVWSPDGRLLLYFRSEAGGTLFFKRPGDAGPGERLVSASDRSYPSGWSPDGTTVIYAQRNVETNWDLNVVTLGDRRIRVFANTRFNEQHGQFSPDGRWVAFTSDESGGNDVYIMRVDSESAEKVRVTPAGGLLPRWRRDGKELFYTLGDQLFAVDIDLSETSPRVGRPRPLFRSPDAFGRANPSGQTAGYAVSADGQRFLVLKPRNPEPQRIELIANWKTLLTARAQ